jgi:hypothetical protein
MGRSKLAGLVVACLIFGVVNAVASSREYTWDGLLSVFSLLSLWQLTLLGISGRPLGTSLVITGLLVGIDQADRFKFAELRQHLHQHDLDIILQFIQDLEFGIFFTYSAAASTAAGFLVVLMLSSGVSWRLERPAAPVRIRAFVGVTLLCLSIAATEIFMSSGYMDAIRRQMPARVTADRGPLRVSAMVAGLSASISLTHTLSADAANWPPAPIGPAARSCGNCPDIIIVHLESVFDPQFEAAFADMPPLAKVIASPLESWSTQMQVHTWGGNSVVTEFELLCSVNHQLFGWGGLQPHVNVAPHFKSCLGNDLKSLGYENHVFYSLNGDFSGVRTAFRRYGFDDFRDFSSLELPDKWEELHDLLIYRKLLEALKSPRTGPRAYFVSTNWNHGPHGLSRLSVRYPGPYDLAKADRPALADYVNRLNDSVTALTAVLNFARSAPYPITILAYGDHHPAFAKHYAQRVLETIDEPDFITPLLMWRNFEGPSVKPKVRVTVEEAASLLTKFAGVKPSGRLKQIEKVQARCGGDQRLCSMQAQSFLRSVNLSR